MTDFFAAAEERVTEEERAALEQERRAARRAKLGRVLDLAGLAALPDPEPLIEGVLTYRSAVLMVGATGTNKTFTALGMACSVATGKPWLGRAVALTGPVVYVVGEGAFGLKHRIAAWQEHNGATVPPGSMRFALRPASLADPEFWAALADLVRELSARLVVLDTFSSLAPDADETTDAARATRYLADLAADNDCTAILVHHTGWGPQDRARGGSQLEANVDEVLVLKKADPEDPNSQVSIKRKKVKDGPAGAEIWVERVEVGPSVVLSETSGPEETKGAGTRRPGHADLQRIVADWVAANPPTTAKKVITAVMAESKVGRDKVTAAFEALERGGLIREESGKVREGNREVTRPVWVPGGGRVRLPNRTGQPDPEES